MLTLEGYGMNFINVFLTQVNSFVFLSAGTLVFVSWKVYTLLSYRQHSCGMVGFIMCISVYTSFSLSSLSWVQFETRSGRLVMIKIPETWF